MPRNGMHQDLPSAMHNGHIKKQAASLWQNVAAFTTDAAVHMFSVFCSCAWVTCTLKIESSKPRKHEVSQVPKPETSKLTAVPRPLSRGAVNQRFTTPAKHSARTGRTLSQRDLPRLPSTALLTTLQRYLIIWQNRSQKGKDNAAKWYAPKVA